MRITVSCGVGHHERHRFRPQGHHLFTWFAAGHVSKRAGATRNTANT
nr:hypothetical protein [Kibdelosporangium sp. MJ126-NF4]CTQ98791.1 hypothetical protein [Kibdelosporangium sp. MJ126-NF4]